MNKNLSIILSSPKLNKEDLVYLLSLHNASDIEELYTYADKVRRKTVGDKVYLRGLIEYSNNCAKNCNYCGIRAGNIAVKRYELSEEEVLQAANFAWKNRYGSIVIQSGERSDNAFVKKIESVLVKIKQRTNNEIGITLSCGEQTEDTYRRWFEAGAHRYLLRIETSNPILFKALHPNDSFHCFEDRLNALGILKKIGYQTGTGVMIGLPGQTIEDLANDLLFFDKINIHMVGMGPYIEHEQTPLIFTKKSIIPLVERLTLTLKMLAVLRILIKDINMASTTALQAIDPMGRTMALRVGANVIMPNITPQSHRENYQLYKGKPGMQQSPEDSKQSLDKIIVDANLKAGYGEWGDSKRFILVR